MTRSAALVGAVAVLLAMSACGSDQDPTLDGSVPSSTSSTGPPPAAVPAPDPAGCTGAEASVDAELRVQVSHDPLRAGAPVTWVLTLTNIGDAEVELVFGSGQDGEAALVGTAGEVYRWSEGMAFAQVVRCQSLPPGATATYELADDALDVEPGDYQLKASVVARPAPPQLVTTVSVEG